VNSTVSRHFFCGAKGTRTRTTDGKAIKTASMTEEHTRCSLMNIVERSITAERLVTELEAALTVAGGPPKILRMDNDPELVSQVLQWFCDGKTGLVYIPPSCPWVNGCIESFNNRLRKECLNRNRNILFEARVLIGDFKHEHNHRHRNSPASLWMQATMAFDGPPVHDHFKKIDDHAVMGIMNGKNALDNGRYAYFYLERV
jgi:transposase InsO family protein